MLEKIEEFECHLNGTSFSANTIRSYLASVRQYQEEYEKLSLKNLKSYRQSLIARYRPKTVNLRIRGINLYLDFIGRGKWRQSFVKEQQSTFLENVISEADYDYLKSCLIQDKEYSWYFVVRFLGATGARISELLQLKVENVRAGHLDLYTKGGKFRRIYVPRALQADALTWLEWETRHRLCFSQPAGPAHNLTGHIRPAEKVCRALQHRSGGGLSSLLPSPLRQKLS